MRADPHHFAYRWPRLTVHIEVITRSLFLLDFIVRWGLGWRYVLSPSFRRRVHARVGAPIGGQRGIQCLVLRHCVCGAEWILGARWDVAGLWIVRQGRSEVG
jgi:hypothetical protein